MIFGYARVSTSDQNFDAQLDQLRDAGAERVFDLPPPLIPRRNVESAHP